MSLLDVHLAIAEASRLRERADIVEWLRKEAHDPRSDHTTCMTIELLAAAIERGEHEPLWCFNR